MDGDDLSINTRFEKEICFLDKHQEYAFVSALMVYFDENGDFRQGTGFGEPKLCQFAKESPFSHAACMIRRDAIMAVGGYRVSDRYLRVEDWDLWIRLYG
jgi:glycosyltransferase EpsE